VNIFRRLAVASALLFLAVTAPSTFVAAAASSSATVAAGQAAPGIPLVGAPITPTTTTESAVNGAPTGYRITNAADTQSPQPTPTPAPQCDPVPDGIGGVVYPCSPQDDTVNANSTASAKKSLDALLKTSCSTIPTGTQNGPLEGVLTDLSQPHATIADRSYNLAVWIYSMGITFSITWFLLKVLPTLDHPTDAFRTGAFKALSLCVFMLLIQFAAGKGFFANNTDAQGHAGATAAQTLTAFSTTAANYIGQDPANPIGRISSAGDAFAVFSCLGDKVTAVPPLAIAAYSTGSLNPLDAVSSSLAALPVTILAIVAGLVCDLVGVILAVNMFFLQWSALIIASASIFVLGLSSMEWTMPYANGYWRFVWSTMIGQFAVVLSTLIIMRLVETTENTQITQMATHGTQFGIVPLGDILAIIFVLTFAAAIAIGTPAIASAIASGEGSGLTPGKMALPLMALGGAGFFAASNLMKGIGALSKLAEGLKNSGGSNALTEGKEKADAARNEIAGEQADTMPTGSAPLAAPDHKGTGPANPVAATAAKSKSHGAAEADSEVAAPAETETHEALGVNEVDAEEAEFEMDEVLADAGRARAEVQSATDAAKGTRGKATPGSSFSSDAATPGGARARGEGPQRGAAAGSGRRAAKGGAPARATGAKDGSGAADVVLAEGDALAARIETAVSGASELNARAIYQSVAGAHGTPAATAAAQGDAAQTSTSQQAGADSSSADPTATLQSAAGAPDATTARSVASAVGAASAARFTGATANAYASAAEGNVQQAMSQVASASVTHAREVEGASALLALASSDPKTLTVGNSAMRSRATASRAIAKAAQSVGQMQSLATTPEQQQAVAQAATSVVSAATNLATSGPSAQTYAALGAASDSVAQAVVSVGPAAAVAAAGAVDNLALACSAMSTIAQESAPSLTPARPPTPTRRFTTIRRSAAAGGGAPVQAAGSAPSGSPPPAAAAPTASAAPSTSIPASLQSLEAQFTPDESQSFRLGTGADAAGDGSEMAAQARRQDLRQRREMLRQQITGVGQRALDAIAHDQHISGVAPDARHLGNTKH
jgi:hypothetical protein